MIIYYLVFDSRRIELFKDDPILTGSIPSESIIFRDLPLTFDNKHIITHLKANSSIHMRFLAHRVLGSQLVVHW